MEEAFESTLTGDLWPKVTSRSLAQPKAAQDSTYVGLRHCMATARHTVASSRISTLSVKELINLVYETSKEFAATTIVWFSIHPCPAPSPLSQWHRNPLINRNQRTDTVLRITKVLIGFSFAVSVLDHHTSFITCKAVYFS